MQQLEPLTLSQLAGQIDQVMKNAFTGKVFWVVADVTNHNYRQLNDWHFFTLAEKQENTNALVAKIETVAWKTGSSRIREFEHIAGQKFRNGLNVLVKVSVDYSPSYGLKLTLLDIDSNFTIGALEKQRQEVLRKLLAECGDYIKLVGNRYVTRNNQLRLNPVIQSIALIASDNTAGFEDFNHILKHNAFGYSFNVDTYFTPVQGNNNASLLKQKLIDIFLSNKRYDAVVIIRGGGSQTDFLIFDSFILAQTVAKFPVPIITGIGHQRNETIVDLMAHSPTNVPTKAAEYIIAHNRLFEEQIVNAQKSIIIKSQQLFSSNYKWLSLLNSCIVNNTQRTITGHKDSVTHANQLVVNKSKTILFRKRTELLASSSQILVRPQSTILNKVKDLNNLLSNLQNYSRIYFQNQGGYLRHFNTVFKMMSPENILNKGFAIVYYNEKVIADASNIKKGDEIKILLSKTQISTSVISKQQSDGNTFKL